MTGSIGFYEPQPTDRELTAEGVREVVREQFPELAVDTIRRLGDGWEHEAYLVDERVVFRFPRFADIGRGFHAEERRLALVSSVVGDVVGIPRITFWGKPSARFPHPFAGHELIPGVEANDPRAAVDPALADDLGRALARIHAIPADAAAAAGIDTSVVHRTDLPAAVQQVRSWVDQVPEIRELAPDPYAWLAEAPPPPRAYEGTPRFIHDDLQMEHVIVHPATGRLSGIIDWGGQLGDPARDFSYVLLHGGWSFLQRALDAYDLPLDADFAKRTLFSARLGALAWLADALKRGGKPSRELPIVRRVFELE
ncbi:MAG TPA: aminoglycoside phosphotransferase family protein [Longimicrobium sp.]|jgi:aminoglycoside phosphotransferase (APT) family kinase protein